MIELITNLGPIIVGLAGIVFGYVFNRQILKHERLKDERKEIYKKLNAFYGPFQQRLQKTWELTQLFKANRSSFRTLTVLLSGNKFEGNDKILLEEIIALGKEMEELILTQGGLVDDSDLRQILVKASAHFRILRLAYEEQLTGDVDRFEDYVYPRELDKKIDDQIQKLKARLNELNRA